MKLRKVRLSKRIFFIILGMFCFLFLSFYFEIKSSYFQAKIFSSYREDFNFSVKEGESKRIYFPEKGPYDFRLGYSRIPEFINNLKKYNYVLEKQAEISNSHYQLIKRYGVFPIYNEKSVSGIEILDSRDQTIYSFKRPEKVFSSFQEIPKILIDTLLFIENRELLDTYYLKKNPAVEWDRFAKALFEKSKQLISPDHSAPGGSTLATQMEKYRHSPEGRTRKAGDKIQQMLSASFRAYLNGEQTLDARKKIVLDYINTVPLSALPGYGEVNGLGDGLWAWYGVELEEISKILNQSTDTLSPEKLKEYALAFKQVLSLFLSHRRPSSYLLVDVKILNAFTDDYLELLNEKGIIGEQLRNLAQEQDLYLRTTAPSLESDSFLDRKAANAIRTKLLSQLGVSKLYELDQIDLKVKSTINKEVQDKVTALFASLKDKSKAKELGLTGEHGLSKGDPAKVIYSLTLYEQENGKNLLRVQTDNYDKPFSINEGTKLDLGSTAKLRVLTNYLEIIAELYSSFKALSLQEINREISVSQDPLSKWVLEYLASAKNVDLEKVLVAALERKYSASPAETFFTGGGLHNFVNFKKEDNFKIPTVAEAIRHSINLPFIRLIRDIVKFYMAKNPASPTRERNRQDESTRQQYLARFADKEGIYFLEQFYKKYSKLSKEAVLSSFLEETKKGLRRLAAVFRYLYPEKSEEELSEFLDSWLLNFSDEKKYSVKSLYQSYSPDKYSLQDQGFLAKVHPLELWLVKYLLNNPQAKFSQIVEASSKERQEVYQWLFKSKSRFSQDRRIKEIIEKEAFLEMHKSWKRLAYPFESLVPSYATAIGSSGDRPIALAELLGIILNNGVRYSTSRIEKISFAEDTPFTSILANQSSSSEKVMEPEVAKVLKKVLVDIVENGTARRVNKAFKTEKGEVLFIGGKTGTGDNRFETFGPGGVLISSRVVNRTATFAFFIGKRFFGVITAHVQGEEAEQYEFTSALAAGLLKALSRELSPLLAKEDNL